MKNPINENNLIPKDIKLTFQEILKEDTLKDILYDIKIKGDKCYYHSVEVKTNEPVYTQIFDYNDEFKRDFLEPFIEHQANNSITNNPVIQNKGEHGNDLYFISNKGSFTKIEGLENKYTQEIFENIERRKKRNNNYTRRLEIERKNAGFINIMTILILIALIINIFVILSLK